MSDTKKYSIAEYVSLGTSALLTLLFSFAFRRDKLWLGAAAVLINAVFIFFSGFIAKKQSGKTDRDAAKNGLRCSVIYIVILIAAVIILPATGRKYFNEDIAPDICAYAISAVSIIFALAVHYSWRSAYKKLINRKPAPLMPLLSVITAVAILMIPVNVIEDVIPVPERHTLPSPYKDGFVRYLPDIPEDTLLYYVSAETGNDANDGTDPSAPLQTVSAAKEKIRLTEEKPACTAVLIERGAYPPESFLFDAEDSGTPENRIIYIAKKGVASTVDNLTVKAAMNTSYITLAGLELTQNDTAVADGDNITFYGCSFNGCSLTLNGSGNILTNNEFSMTNGPAVTVNGIDNTIEYNYFHDIKLTENGALTVNGTDTDITGNCFDSISQEKESAYIYIADEADGTLADGNMLLNTSACAVSHPGKENTFKSLSGNFILNAEAPVVSDRSGQKNNLKFNNNILITLERADNYPLNAVFSNDETENIFTDAENGDYSLKTDSPVCEAFTQITDIVLYPPSNIISSVEETTGSQIIVSPESTETVTETENPTQTDTTEDNEYLVG